MGDRTNMTALKLTKFQKMMVDAQIRERDDLEATNNLNRLFISENKNLMNLSFKKFLNMIPKIAILKYPNIEVSGAMFMLIEKHFKILF